MTADTVREILGEARVVFVCGPPGAGKDTWARRLALSCECRNVVIHKMAHLLDEMTLPLFRSEMQFRLYREALKEEPCPALGGKSLRAWYQELSERVLKPMIGPAGIGEACLGRMLPDLDRGRTVLVSDSGFAAEAVPVLRSVGARRCVQVRLHREGHTFAGDTRGWWGDDIPGLRMVEVRNLAPAGESPPDAGFELLLPRPAVALLDPVPLGA